MLGSRTEWNKMQGVENMLIYVVEDERSINEIECYALKSSNFEVMPFYSAAELKKGMEKKIPDLIVLDVMLPDNDGIAMIGHMRDDVRLKNTPIILVSARSSEIEKVRGLDAGADDYITKPFGIMELVSRVKELLRRVERRTDRTNLLIAGDITIDEQKREVIYQGQNIYLTYKEFELLRYLVINKGIVLSRDKIMENVWGFDFQGESRTVDMHIKTLRSKLGQGRAIIKTVRNVGYKLN